MACGSKRINNHSCSLTPCHKRAGFDQRWFVHPWNPASSSSPAFLFSPLRTWWTASSLLTLMPKSTPCSTTSSHTHLALGTINSSLSASSLWRCPSLSLTLFPSEWNERVQRNDSTILCNIIWLALFAPFILLLFRSMRPDLAVCVCHAMVMSDNGISH